jgi:hypothetical protein
MEIIKGVTPRNFARELDGKANKNGTYVLCNELDSGLVVLETDYNYENEPIFIISCRAAIPKHMPLVNAMLNFLDFEIRVQAEVTINDREWSILEYFSKQGSKYVIRILSSLPNMQRLQFTQDKQYSQKNEFHLYNLFSNFEVGVFYDIDALLNGVEDEE